MVDSKMMFAICQSELICKLSKFQLRNIRDEKDLTHPMHYVQPSQERILLIVVIPSQLNP